MCEAITLDSDLNLAVREQSSSYEKEKKIVCLGKIQESDTNFINTDDKRQ